MKKKPSEHNGVVLIDKPAGMTSHDVVDLVRRLFGTRRVGHTGTLDPDATGVLVLCLGYATRIAEYLSAGRKTYCTEIRFGIETDTEDTSGKIIRETSALHLTQSDLETVLPQFRGDILQVPPMVSALHYEGKRLHELAREGITVEREARPITIYNLELERFSPGDPPIAQLSVTCSSGTYIRTLAADLGKVMNVGGAMQALRRTHVSNGKNDFSLENCLPVETLKILSDNNELENAVMPLSQALQGWVQVMLNPTEVLDLKMGRQVSPSQAPDFGEVSGEACEVAVCDTEGVVFAIARYKDGLIRPTKVLIPL